MYIHYIKTFSYWTMTIWITIITTWVAAIASWIATITSIICICFTIAFYTAIITSIIGYISISYTTSICSPSLSTNIVSAVVIGITSMITRSASRITIAWDATIIKWFISLINVAATYIIITICWARILPIITYGYMTRCFTIMCYCSISS